jgi:hypothetical protein
MADINLPQAEADALIAMEKFRTDTTLWNWPNPGERLAIPLMSADREEDMTFQEAAASLPNGFTMPSSNASRWTTFVDSCGLILSCGSATWTIGNVERRIVQLV